MTASTTRSPQLPSSPAAPSSPAPPAAPPYSLLRSWVHCLLTAEAIAVLLYVTCTVRLMIKNADASPAVTSEAFESRLWFVVGFSAWVLAGYLLIGLQLAGAAWLIFWSWSSTFGRRLTPRLMVFGTAAVSAGIVLFKLVSMAVYSPLVLENFYGTEAGIRLVSWVCDLVPAGLVLGLRVAIQAAACLLIVSGIVSALRRRSERTAGRMTVPALFVVPLIAVAGLSLTLGFSKAPSRPRVDNTDRPNILILASDGLRADHLGLYGYGRPTSPNIDRFAQEAVKFDNCYVALARTLPSWTSILTGLAPHTHGQRYTWPRDSKINLSLPTLCTELKKQGYRNLVLADWAGGDFGKVNYGFDHVSVAPEAWNINTWIAQGTCQGHPLLVGFADNPVGYRMYPVMNGMPVNPNPQWVTRQAVSALDDLEHGKQPFFMVVFYSETHLPYATRYPYYKKFTDPNYVGRHKLSVNVPSMELVARGEVDSSTHFDVDQTKALYDGAVLSFDDQVGEVLQALRDFKLWQNTIVVVMSDHGEDLFEVDSSWGHGRFFFGDDYDQRIPLVISDPALRRRGAKAVPQNIDAVDLMPTLLERVGAAPPASCQGQSLLSLMRDEAGCAAGAAGSSGATASAGAAPGAPGIQVTSQFQERPIFAESAILMGGDKELERRDFMRYPSLLEMLEVTERDTGQVGLKREFLDLVVEARHRMVRTRDWKLIYMPLKSGAAYELYDLRTDPLCTTDVKEQHPAKLAELQATLWDWMLKDPLRHRSGDHLVRN